MRRLAAAILLSLCTATAGLTVSTAAQAGCASGATKYECEKPKARGAQAIGNCPGGHHCVYFSYLETPGHYYFDGDPDFRDDRFNQAGADNAGFGEIVNDNLWSARNSTSSNKESHYYYDPFPNTGSRLVFCMNPDRQVTLPDEGNNTKGDGIGKRDEVSSLIIRNRTLISCF